MSWKAYADRRCWCRRIDAADVWRADYRDARLSRGHSDNPLANSTFLSTRSVEWQMGLFDHEEAKELWMHDRIADRREGWRSNWWDDELMSDVRDLQCDDVATPNLPGWW